MRIMLTISGVILLLSISIFAQNKLSDYANNWHQWRGPLGTGFAPEGNPPVEWNENKNIRWKTRLPGIGYGTPVIWGNDIFVSTAILPEGFTPSGRSIPSEPVKLVVVAVNRTDGRIRWERIVREEIPHAAQHPTSTWSTSSPITDGKHVYAYFGSFGLYCLTMEGDLVWEKDFGDLNVRNQDGEGNTPSLYKNRLIVIWDDHVEQSFIVALDSATGEEIWKKNRDEGNSWATPLVVEDAGRTHVITPATNRVRSYDFYTGELLWEDEGLTPYVIPSPVAADGVVYVTSEHRGNAALRAIRLSEAKGNIAGTSALLWSYNQNTPYVPSPLLHGGLLYFLKSNQGILTCLNVASGQPHYANQRLESIGSMYASPVGVQDRVYLLGRNGTTMVIPHGPEFSVLATNTLDDNFAATPVIVGDEIYLRGHQYLYCIAE